MHGSMCGTIKKIWLMKNISNCSKFFLIAIIIGSAVYFTSYNYAGYEFAEEKIQDNEHKLSYISLGDLLVLRKSGSVILLDFREKEFYDYAHIPGALNIPAKELLASNIPKRIITTLSKASNVIIYSNAYKNTTASKVMSQLALLGLKSIKYYSAGYEQWKACGLPMKGTDGELNFE